MVCAAGRGRHLRVSRLVLAAACLLCAAGAAGVTPTPAGAAGASGGKANDAKAKGGATKDAVSQAALDQTALAKTKNVDSQSSSMVCRCAIKDAYSRTHLLFGTQTERERVQECTIDTGQYTAHYTIAQNGANNRDLRCGLRPTTCRRWVQNTSRIQNAKSHTHCGMLDC